MTGPPAPGTAGDPLGTAPLRQRVLAAWAASPARFREDANAEEDQALGGYRDRLVVELAQNGADAARRAGVPGRLLLRLSGNRLVAANTGSPLDAAGVSALATLRASGKRDDTTVGRFGVGFSAVLAVSDDPAVGSVPVGVDATGPGRAEGGARTGIGVRFSRSATAAAVGALPAVAGELARRGGHVPVLRLPWPADVEVPAGYDTAVVLPLRDAAAEATAARLLEEVDAALLLVLPTLHQVRIEIADRSRVMGAERTGSAVVLTVDGAAWHWRLREAAGRIAPHLLADRPVEERARPSWQLTWAVAHAGQRLLVPPPDVAPVLHAPTPTDEPLALPALLVAGFPLDPGRRHVAPGALTEDLVARAAATYAALARELAEEGVDVAPLVPSPVPAGALDAAIRRAVLAALTRTPLLPAAEDRALLLRPGDAVVLDGAGTDLVAALAPVLAGLAAPGWPRPALDAAGVRRVRLADVVDDLAGLSREPRWWRDLYAALAGAPPEELAALPVPLADGRLVRGPRGTLLPAAGTGAALLGALAPLGLRIVDPEAAHPLLERLGAAPLTSAAVLADPAVAAAVDGATADAEAARLAEAVLELVSAAEDARVSVEELPWLGGLLLADEDGEGAPADELVLPGSPAAAMLADVPLVHPRLVRRWGAEVLERVGVTRTLRVARLEDVALDPDELDAVGLDAGVVGLGDWAEDVLETLPRADLPPLVPELLAVRDLADVADDAWPLALHALAAPPLREAVVAPTRVVLPGGAARDVPSPAAWWLRHHARIDGRRPGELRLAGSDARLAGLYAEIGGPLPGGAGVAPSPQPDEELLRAVGVRTSLDALLAERGGPDDLLDRVLATALPAPRLRSLYAALAGVDPRRVGLRDRVRVPDGPSSRVVPASEALVADGPQWLALPWPSEPIAVPEPLAEPLADLLDVALCSERAAGRVRPSGVPAEVPAVVRRVLAAPPERWHEHTALTVDGHAVDWWVDAGVVHAATPEGLAAGLAWAAGQWRARWLVAAVLAEPHRVDALLAAAAFDAAEPAGTSDAAVTSG